MNTEEAGPPAVAREAPASEEETAPPPPEEAEPGEEAVPLPVGSAVPSVTNYRSLLPDDEEDPKAQEPRVRPRIAPRPVDSVLSEVLSESSRRSSKYRRSMSGIPNLQETLKEKQARFREARENRKMKIDPGYKYIFEILAEKLGLDLPAVEELILDCPSMEPFIHFFEKDGCKTLKFLYQEGDVPGLECGRIIHGAGKGAKMMRLYIDNAAPEKLKGLCIFFVRCRNDVPINAKTIHKEVLFTVLDASKGLLNGIKNMLANVFLPAILATNNWGALNQSKQAESEKHIFTETISRYLSFFDGARISIEGTVMLKKIDNVDFSRLHTFEEVTVAAGNSETVHQLEEVLMIWYKQIEQVLIESEQMRKEADDSGPLTELEHWKHMSAKFNYIIEQIKGPACKAVINVLNVAHSKLLKNWHDLDARITDTANESKDNVKYLYTLEKVCQPLYNYDLDCIFLFKEYQTSFHKTRKQILESSGEKSFEVSEMYIFGKFEAFCKRLEKLEINHTVERILQYYVAELEATKKKNSEILSSSEGKAVIRQYNKISYVLVEFEVVYHMAWVREISQLQYALQATLFVRHPETGKLLVNFDPKILEIVRETKCMIKMKLDVPEQAKRLLKLESKLKADKLYLQGLLQYYGDLCQEVPSVFVNLMTPKMKQVEAVLRQGLTILTWSSLTLESFFQEVQSVLGMFSQLLKKVSDLCEMSIDTVLKEIANTVLISLPESGAARVEDMLTLNETYTKEWADIINHKSRHVEEAVKELTLIFEQIYEVKNTGEKGRQSPEHQKHVVFGSETEDGENNDYDTDVVNVGDTNDKENEFKKVMVPSLDDIQQAINRMIQLTLEVSRGVAHWGQQHAHHTKSVVTSPTVTDFTHGSTGKQLKKEEKPMKLALSIEAKAWKMLLCRYLNEEYKKKMSDMIAFINEYLKKLSRPIRDLDDVRFAVEALTCIHDNEIQMDMTLGPVEEAYGILNRFEVEVTKEESEAVDTLRYSFNKLQSKAVSVQDELVQVQPVFKSNLLEAVEVFCGDVMNFAEAYETASFDDLWRKFVTYSSGEQLFGLPVTDYEVLHKTRKELNLLQKLYGLYDTVMGSISGYYEILWGDVDIEKINTELQEFQNRCRKLPKGLKDWQAFLDLRKRIDDFSESCPLLEMMTNKAMKQRHWDRISELTKTPFDVESDSFCLRNIMGAPLLKNKDDIEDICISAVKEKDIEAKLTQVIENWTNQNLSFAAFKGKGELLLKGTESGEIITLMEDSLMILGSLLNNRYNAPFKKNIQNWVYKLSTSSDIIEEWLVVQNLWVYLEAVFVGGDIAKQLPQEAKRFQNIDKSWIKIMQRAHENPNVISCCVGDETMGQLLPHLHEQLEVCQKSLTGYLEKKRLLFPRFFFVSDPVLLEILGQASDSHTIQLDNPIMAKGPVEIWLLDLLKVQMSSLHNIIRSAFYQISDSGFQLLPFLSHFPAQVGLLGIQMLWTHDSEEALHNAKDDRKIMQMTNQKFLDILNTLISQTTRDLTKFDRVKFETLITIHVHQRDIFDDLVKMHIKSATDFEWLKQSRFYFKEDLDQTVVSITDVDFIYQNEFLGCTDRLVITPLTDRCYITLAQALGMNMGGAPAGPAGTGKTETTKDMGRCLGKYVVVFNCSDQMDFRGLGRIFKGKCLSQSGSWGCFDEFNRIELPVLSVAAQQIYIVLTARKERKKQFIFSDGDCVDLNPEFGIFLTMNPGYAGRQELPENLKIQFRTVAMMVPDRQIIMRVKLASCGFLENVILAQKFYVLYKLCEEQLTKQVDEDEPLFLSLINDLFPGLQLDSNTYVELQGAVANQVQIEGLINHPPWNLKLIQMFGRLDTATNDWTDGIFSTLWRKTLKAKKGENIFLILDGPVDAIWIENLNSVLDDNKTLTLANGDRIPMAPSCKLLFEVHNIENASPATVSRMGMVYISSSALSWRAILQAWLKRRTAQEATVFQALYDKAFEDAYTFMKLNLAPKMQLLECNYIVQAVLLTGEQGTAKTVMIKAYLKKYDPEVQLSKSLNFSSATEPMMFQRTIESYVDKRMGSTYGPPGGRKMTVFIDDINMPVINEWGDQITNEIVRQMMEMKGMYSLDKPGDFTTVVDVQLIAAMIHPGGGRNDIPQRLKRQFTVFNCTLPSNASIDKIFGLIGCGYFDPCRKFKLEVCEMIANLVTAGRVLWQWTKVKMLPTPSKFHYIFNLRDLSRIWQGMLTVKAEECDSLPVLMSLFKHECNRVIADRFITPEDEQWFNVHLIRAVEENISPEAASCILPEPYFVDFLREMPEPTGDEPEDTAFEIPKVYELISSLFARDEMDEITQGLTAVMKRELPRHPPTFDNLYEYFISRSRKNLHVVLCFSPVGEKFRARSLKFPGLISGCTIDWFSRWPKEALVAVASHFLSEYNIVCSSEIKRQVVETMGLFHDMVSESCENYFQRYRRRAHVTPKSYLSFINGYKNIYTEKVKYINEQAERMNIGLDKLMEASESIAKLSQDLAIKEKELAVASVKADKVLAEVTVSTQASAKVKNEEQEVKDKAQKIVDEIDSEKVKAETKLEAAKPALEEAEAALNTIKPNDIATVRKLAKPPHLIMRIMDCVLLLFQKKIDPVTMDPEKPCCKPSWGESLKLMSATGFLWSLQQFPKDTINEETVELLQPYFNMDDYNFESAKKVCGNVAGLLSWTLAMATFYGINREVLPLKANLAKQEGRLAVANAELGKAQALLDEKQAELDKVQAKFVAAMKEKMDLLNDADMCRKKMQAASALIDGLSGEKVRWTQQSKEFKAQINRLVGDILLCTGFLSYLGPFNQIFRNYLLKDQWEVEMKARRIPFTENLNLISMLVDPPTIGEWGLQGLPGDDLSIQNGIIVTKATRYPLLIDPQAQGKTWIKSKEKENDLQVTTLNHKYFRTHLEDSLSLGRPMLIEDIREELDPALDNVLEKNFIKSGTTFKVKVGDKEYDVMDTFKLYITTKLPNPAFTPEINAKTSIIDFTVTVKGLENQLLRRVILTEKQELESERVKLLEDVTFNKRKMKELEDNLLYKLSATKGSLVDDESLIGVLRITKQTAAEVSEKLHVAAETEIKINTAQEEFRPAATRGSILYFLITEMSMVNIMYQTSLAQFLKLFNQSMARSEKSPLPQKRIMNIIEYLTYEVFTYSVRGLYENHKFLFVLLMTLKIDLQRGTVKHREFQALIKGGAALDLKACPPKPFRWILDMTWLNLVELSKLPQFAEIMNQISRNEKGWKSWFDKDAPEEEVIPDGYNDSLDTWRKLLLIRSWCPDRTVFQARKYIADSLEEKYTEPVILNLEKTWEESDTRTPLICFLSMGSDPTIQIDALAKKLKLECRTVSMGQGQEVHARKLIQMSMKQGGWVLLQNCHLGLEFMEELLETLMTTEANDDSFRVWITTEPHDRFPITLLQGVSWSTVRYMIGEVQYGGRVTDDFDKRLLNCFARVWFIEKMFEPSFCFYTGYKIPVCKTLDQYFEYIQSLPSLDNPEVFGLHPNADITYQSNTASAVLETITNIQPKESGGGVGETREAIVYRLSEDMLSKLPPDYVPHENLRDALDNMYDARIPQIWKRVSWDSSTLGFWFTELLERNAQFSTWIFEGRPNVFWMTGFFNPQGFLTAMRQEVTRAHKGWALDTVTIHNEVLWQTKEEITTPPVEGVYIYGLYLDGAAWDRRNGKLTESTPKVLFTLLPVLHVFAINSTAPKDPKLYVCPVYKKPKRTDLTFITVVYLRTVLSPDHWILRGVALLCDIK
ncbi:Dynein heavy chain 8, axonemal [Heterocephalus glaber]|uniref:Dynein heavy chain 8, axonemal n=1 Tax=Heterocephalus glaber TaxID=10181 RepID=G5B9F3_HETGA|nr:Dynein heavy chain 8, axonemal [Heterocephalus glaber]